MGCRRAKSSLLLGFALSLLCIKSYAGLGADAASILADSDEFHGSVQIQSLPQFEIHEITTSYGVRVREFLDRQDLIFAVAWDGPVEPDLQSLLGRYFAPYHQARSAQTPPGVRRNVQIALPDLILESGGRMRAYRGWAYLPTHLPEGVSPAELR